MDQRTTRIVAVSRKLGGETVSSICQSLNKSRRWLYYWLHRYSPKNAQWAESRSRAPHRHPGKTPSTFEALVCEVRRQLVLRKYSQHGAIAIQWELKRLGVNRFPAIWTINRILRRHGLSTKPIYQPRGTLYPALRPKKSNIVHQLDLVGPRYLQGGIRFYGFQLIDAFSNAVALEVLPTKQDKALVQALLCGWRRLGLPDYLQIDNELSFRGSNRYPRSFGLLIRTCLNLGVEVVFIPEREPWRNRIVERFNDVYDKLFIRSQQFSSLEHLQSELAEFERFHNAHHRYAKLGQRTPSAVHSRSLRRPPTTLQELSWKDGRISFIRLTDQRGTVRFFTERFFIDRSLVHEYVKGTIYTRKGILRFFHQGRTIKTINYKISKNRKV